MFRRHPHEPQMHPHPKVFTIPLGPRFDTHSFFERAVDVLESEAPRARQMLYSGSLLGIRGAVAAQLVALHGANVHLARAIPPSAFEHALMSSTFVASPPGMGGDCYRHYEALLAGSLPVVLRTPVALSTLHSMPVMIVDDYSVANASTLQHVARALGARVRAWRLGLPVTSKFTSSQVSSATGQDSHTIDSPLAALTMAFWRNALMRASRHVGPRAPFRLGAPSMSIYVPGEVKGHALRDSKVVYYSPLSPRQNCPCNCGLCWPPAAPNTSAMNHVTATSYRQTTRNNTSRQSQTTTSPRNRGMST